MSIYDNPNFKFKTSSQEDYYDSLRKSLEERTNNSAQRIQEDYLAEQSSIGDAKDKAQERFDKSVDNFSTQKSRLKEDFMRGNKQMTKQLASVLKRTYSRYVSKAPNSPTQLGLIAIQANAAQAERSRMDFDRQRSFDRASYDIGQNQKNSQVNYDDIIKQFQSLTDDKELTKNRAIEDLNRGANSTLNEYNRNEYSYYNSQSEQLAKSGVFGQNSLSEENPYKFNNKVSYGY